VAAASVAAPHPSRHIRSRSRRCPQSEFQLGGSVCAAAQPACPQVSRCVPGRSGSGRKYLALTSRSGTQRARRLRSRMTVGTSAPWCSSSPPATFALRAGSRALLAGSNLAPSPPIGLTAAGLFAGGEVSRADSRVRWPGHLDLCSLPSGQIGAWCR